MVENTQQSFILRLISPFTYPQKFVLISCLFLFSIVVSSYFMISTQNSLINFVKNEMKGIEYAKLVRKLMQDITQHMLLLNRYLMGDTKLKNDIMNLQSEMNGDFDAAMQASNNFQKYFGSKASLSLEAISRKWMELTKSPFELKPDVSNRLHMDIVRDIMNMLKSIGIVSKFESFFMIDNAMVKSVAAQELIVLITSNVNDLIIKKKHTTQENYDLVGKLSLLRDIINHINETTENIINYAKSNQEKPGLEHKIKDPLRQYVDSVNEFILYIEKYIINAQNTPENSLQFLTISQKALDANYVFWNVTIEQLESILRDRLHSYRLQQLFSVLITILGALAGFLLGFLIMRQISKPLTSLVQAARHLSDGDLSARVPYTGNDEVGQAALAFNQMADSFQALIGQLQWTGVQLTTSSTEIAATAKQQESTIVEQEATTKEIAATAREISTSAKDFAKTMSEVSNTAEQTSALATSGKTGLAKMESIMHQMVDAASNIASKLAVLNEKAGTITSIITTISKVADQTNLLSLNAAIEAEKAGEYGRSFAVIAREIRRLADQTANATLDIEKMVNEMVSAVSAGVMGVDKFSEEINTGVKHVATVSEQLTKIIEQVQQQTAGFEAVNQGMQQQSQGAEQINEAINQLSEAAQHTTHSIRQFHNAIEQLNNAAQEMQNAVTKIRR